MNGRTVRRAGPARRWAELAVGVGSLAAAASRATGRGEGGVIGGRVVLGLAPDAMRRLSAGRRVVLVSGTNGKTTTSSMLAAALRTGGPVAANGGGANTPPGIVTALAADRSPTVVLECDEGWLPRVVAETSPVAVVLLNLSRDQLDRHHEVRRLADSWRVALADVPTVVANVDDPNVAWAAGASPDPVWVAAGQWWERDARSCPACGRWLARDPVGGWWCGCGLRRAGPHWQVDGEVLVDAAGRRFRMALRLPGRANRADGALAVAAAVHLGVPPGPAVDALRHVEGVGDRYVEHVRGASRVRLLLAKNPAGWQEVLSVVAPPPATVVVAFNANGVDGRDPSWLYDVSFSALRNRRVVVTGERATDMAVRLAHDGVAFTSAARLAGVLDTLPGAVDVVANYTAFQQARRELRHVR